MIKELKQTPVLPSSQARNIAEWKQQQVASLQEGNSATLGTVQSPSCLEGPGRPSRNTQPTLLTQPQHTHTLGARPPNKVRFLEERDFSWGGVIFSNTLHRTQLFNRGSLSCLELKEFIHSFFPEIFIKDYCALGTMLRLGR